MSSSGSNNRKREFDDAANTDVVAGLPSAASQEHSEKKPRTANSGDDEEVQELISALQGHNSSPVSCRFRLEAMFLPKFDNEHRTDQSIRNEIKERVLAGQGFVEVTLKHSGSLLLWSGGQRFYSKNSANNQVTLVGEILLRQHFFRVSSKLLLSKNNNNNDDENSTTEWLYQKCSDYIEQHRLTLAFEVVTSVLGDHAAVPHRDFLILTAIGDRSSPSSSHDRRHNNHNKKQFFYSTEELLQLAQDLYLPHNDTWTFSSQQSLQELFELYDRSREIGTADTVIPALTAIAERHIGSIYPHDIFHSNILEGFVIRHVPYSTADVKTNETLRAISEKAKQYREEFPSDVPPCYELPEAQNSRSPSAILSVKVRDVFAKARKEVDTHTKDATKGSNDDAEQSTKVSMMPPSSSPIYLKERFEEKLREILRQSGPRMTIHHVAKPALDDFQSTLPAYCVGLLSQEGSSNEKITMTKSDETERIAKVIQILKELGERVQYSLFREQQPTEQANSKKSRWFCMVHVFYDKTFQRFRREQKKHNSPSENELDLFRGFCIELVVDSDSDSGQEASDIMCIDTALEGSGGLEDKSSSGAPTGESHTNPNDHKNSGSALMMKMKLVPYMVRTFGCRNGIRFVRQGGPDRFNKYARDLLTVQWQVSLEATQRWMPFLQAWGEYVHACLTPTHSSATLDQIKVLRSPPLSEDCYLEHLVHFESLYYGTSSSETTNGLNNESNPWSQQDSNKPVFRGLVIVLALDATSAEEAADFIAKEWLNGAKRHVGGAEAVSHEDMLLYCTGIGGRVCCGAVGTEKVRKVRILPEIDKSYISLILMGLSDDEIIASFPDAKDHRRLIGQTTAWRKSKCGAVIDLPNEFHRSNDLNKDVVAEGENKVWEIAQSIPEVDTRTGLLVFFPASIPGCGKSTVLGADTESKLQSTISDVIKSATDPGSQAKAKPRRLSIVEGDRQAKRVKFWNFVKEQRLSNSSSISIADKNVPLPTWEKVGQICASTNGKAVAVIPSSFGVLQTTHVEGARKPDGTYLPEIRHFYPFSLQYLAVCMARVLDREPGSHPGKLDIKQALYPMMVVIKFFTLYRGVTAQNFHDTLSNRLSKAGAFSTTPVELPFFDRSKLGDLPQELHEAILEALCAQRGWDIARADIEKTPGKDEYIKKLEAKLRACLQGHRKLLSSMTVNENIARKHFVSQVAEHALEIDGRSSSYEFIKIVSIDIPRAKLHSLLRKHIGVNADLMDGKLHQDAFIDGEYGGNEYVSNTHITMAHFTQLSQSEMRDLFGSIQGQEVQVEITGMLWSQRIAALTVNISAKTRNGNDVPKPQNSFQHVTIWHKEEVSPSESNTLPELLAAGDSSQIQFSEKIIVSGTIRFWRIGQH